MILSKRSIINNRGIVINVVSAFVIKGLGLIINLMALPLYMRYFDNNIVLGVWFTALSVLNWILSFDIGIGNGLRNKLTVALAHKDYKEGTSLISSSFFSMGILSLVVSIICYIIFPFIDWNSFFNISTDVLTSEVLLNAIRVTFLGIIVSFFLHITGSIIYALQLASINNLKHFVTNLILVLFLFVAPSKNNIEEKLLLISIVYALVINIPSIVLIFWVFLRTEVSNCCPKISAISKRSIKDVLGLGFAFFCAQVSFMILTVTNEWFISKFFEPVYVVNYQVYYRFFSLIGSLMLLGLAPLWSAITKAYAEKRYSWIIKLQRFLYLIAAICVVIQLSILPILQFLINIWLGNRTIQVDYLVATSFLSYSIIIMWNTILSTLVSGLGKLKPQLLGYLFAVVFKIVVIIILSNFTTHWEIVVWATVIGLLPYSIIQPIYINRILKKME